MLLLQYFNELTLQPENAQKLKGLILELAVRGKLTQQWRADNPDTPSAKVLLQQIKAEKKRLIAEKEIKQENPLPLIKAEEIPFHVPDSWVWCRLNDLVSLLGDGLHGTPKYDPYGDYYFINGNNLNDGEIIFKPNTKKVSKEEYLKHKKKLNSRTVFVSINGTIGNSAFYNDEKVVLGKSACYFNLLSNLDKEYIRTIIKSNYFLEYAFESATGTTIKNVSLKTMRFLKIPFPPLEEQKAIVAIVEQLFEEVEQLAALTKERLTIKQAYVQSILQELETGDTHQVWQQLQPNFGTFFDTVQSVKALRQTVLQLAVQGKLTTDWRNQNPNVTPASELLKQIQTEKAALIKAGKITKEKALPKIKAEEIPFELPVGWVWCRMQDICKLITDGTHQTPKYTESGEIFLSAKNVKPFKFNPDNHRFVSKEHFDNYRKNKVPEVNDILLTRVGAGIGEAALIDIDIQFAIYVSIALLKTFTDKINPAYLVIWLNSPLGRRFSAKNTYGKGVSQGNLNLSLIRGFTVSLPPFSEQKAIVQKVEQLLGFCDALEAAVLAKEEKMSALMENGMRGVLAR